MCTNNHLKHGVTCPGDGRLAPLIEEFAAHLSADAKVLDVDKETGIQKYRYVKTGTNHYSFAFTYAWMAVNACFGGRGFLRYLARSGRP